MVNKLNELFKNNTDYLKAFDELYRLVLIFFKFKNVYQISPSEFSSKFVFTQYTSKGFDLKIIKNNFVDKNDLLIFLKSNFFLDSFYVSDFSYNENEITICFTSKLI